MINIFELNQHKDFPEIANGVIIQEPNKNVVNFIGYFDIHTYFTKKSFRFYLGIIPRTYDSEFPTFFILEPKYNLSIFSLVEIIPLYRFIVPFNGLKNIIYAKLFEDEPNFSKESVARELEYFFDLSYGSIQILENSKDHLLGAYNRYKERFRS